MPIRREATGTLVISPSTGARPGQKALTEPTRVPTRPEARRARARIERREATQAFFREIRPGPGVSGADPVVAFAAARLPGAAVPVEIDPDIPIGPDIVFGEGAEPGAGVFGVLQQIVFGGRSFIYRRPGVVRRTPQPAVISPVVQSTGPVPKGAGSVERIELVAKETEMANGFDLGDVLIDVARTLLPEYLEQAVGIAPDRQMQPPAGGIGPLPPVLRPVPLGPAKRKCRRRRRKLLTDSDYNALLKIQTLKNTDNMKIALAKALR